MASDGFCECGCREKAPIAKKTRKHLGHIKGHPVRFVSGHNGKCQGTMENGHNWKGGKYTDIHGYVQVYMPTHIRANQMGYVREHILVLEEVLGRPILPTEVAHHRNKKRDDNSPGNLILFKINGMHTAFHHRLVAYETCGHWDWVRCVYCHQYDRPENMIVHAKMASYHKQCCAEVSRIAWQKRAALKYFQKGA